MPQNQDTSSPVSLPGRLAEVGMDAELPRRADLGLVFDELDYQMACQVYLWALPLVSYAQWQTQHRDIFGATDYDLVHYVSYRDRLGLITANATTPYILNFIDLSRTGPLVIELPPGHTAGGLPDFWQREFAIMGEMGPEQGAGGKHLIVPPGEPVPDVDDSFYVHQAIGMNVMFGFRTLDPDQTRAQALVDAVRVSSYDGRDAPATRIISPDGRAWSGDQPRGLDYWVRLDDIYQHEVVDERDRFYLATLKQLGIEKDRAFEPAVSFSEAMKSQTPGVGQAYLGAYTDSNGDWLAGARDYTIHVPADPPAKLFWSFTVYDVYSRCLIDNDQQRRGRGSRDQDLTINSDGSIDLYFGPSAPAGGEANWVQTIPGRHWFSYFRFYGPLQPYFDRSWKLGDITPS